MIPILKKREKNNCFHYRGIPLLTPASKIYAAILKKKIKIEIEHKIGEEQCGFRKGRSCIDATLVIKQVIKTRKN